MLICGGVRPVSAMHRLPDVQIFYQKICQKFFLKLLGSAYDFNGLIIAKDDDLTRIFNRVKSAARDLTHKPFAANNSVNIM